MIQGKLISDLFNNSNLKVTPTFYCTVCNAYNMATPSNITLTVKMLSGDILSTVIDKDTEMADIYTIVYHLLPEDLRMTITPMELSHINASHQLRLFSLSDEDVFEDIKQEKMIGLLIEYTILSVHCTIDRTSYRDSFNSNYKKYRFEGNYYYTNLNTETETLRASYCFTIYCRKEVTTHFFILPSEVTVVENDTSVSYIKISKDAVLHTFIPYHKMDFYNEVPDYLRNALIEEFERKFNKRILD